MRGITERDIAYDMLFGSKTASKLYCDASLESAHPNVYHLFRELEHHTHESQHRIWEYLHRRNEYRVEEAHPRDIEEVHQRMERLAQDHLGATSTSEYGRFPNSTVGTVPSSWSSGSTYGTTGTGFGTTGTTYGGSSTGYDWGRGESRTEWNRGGESPRNLPDWARETTRR
jgi:hypothetical protein